MRRKDAELQSDTQRPRQRHPPSASLKRPGGGGRGGGGEAGGGRRAEGGASCPRDWSLGLAIIVLKVVGLPMAVTS